MPKPKAASKRTSKKAKPTSKKASSKNQKKPKTFSKKNQNELDASAWVLKNEQSAFNQTHPNATVLITVLNVLVLLFWVLMYLNYLRFLPTDQLV